MSQNGSVTTRNISAVAR